MTTTEIKPSGNGLLPQDQRAVQPAALRTGTVGALQQEIYERLELLESYRTGPTNFIESLAPRSASLRAVVDACVGQITDPVSAKGLTIPDAIQVEYLTGVKSLLGIELLLRRAEEKKLSPAESVSAESGAEELNREGLYLLAARADLDVITSLREGAPDTRVMKEVLEANLAQLPSVPGWEDRVNGVAAEFRSVARLLRKRAESLIEEFDTGFKQLIGRVRIGEPQELATGDIVLLNPGQRFEFDHLKKGPDGKPILSGFLVDPTAGRVEKSEIAVPESLTVFRLHRFADLKPGDCIETRGSETRRLVLDAKETPEGLMVSTVYHRPDGFHAERERVVSPENSYRYGTSFRGFTPEEVLVQNVEGTPINDSRLLRPGDLVLLDNGSRILIEKLTRNRDTGAKSVHGIVIAPDQSARPEKFMYDRASGSFSGVIDPRNWFDKSEVEAVFFSLA